MLCEAFRKLSEFGSLESYRYVGFPAPFFSDFVLFHKALGIRKMIGIEFDPLERKRFEFNRPFRCIHMLYGESNEILPTLSWDAKTILWLDYDAELDRSVLTDVRLSCASACGGSVIVVTVDARPGDFEPGKPRLPRLRRRVGEENLPLGIRERDLAEWGTASIYQRILTNEIARTLNERNGSREVENQFLYKQLFYFCYADGPRMLTVGGLIYERGQENLVAKCGFEKLSFVRSKIGENIKPHFIEVPSLTFREIRHIDGQLPRTKGKGERLHAPKVPIEDLKKYEGIYRYFPAFAEAEL
jgi:hypothetical protein